jgi:diguanylate cyclase
MSEATEMFLALISDMEKRLASLELVATRDPLTGAFNRSGFDHAWQREKSVVDRKDSRLSLAFIDLDHFKNVNDTYGHNVGDRVLSMFADIVRTVIRPSDVFSRYGGEEFVLLLPDVSAEDSVIVLQRIKERTQRLANPKVTFSAGIAEVHKDDVKDDVVKVADAAMYEAKAQGRDRIVVAKRG